MEKLVQNGGVWFSCGHPGFIFLTWEPLGYAAGTTPMTLLMLLAGTDHHGLTRIYIYAAQLSHLQYKHNIGGDVADWGIPCYTSLCPLGLLTLDLSPFLYITGQTSNSTASCKLAACRAEDEPRASNISLVRENMCAMVCLLTYSFPSLVLLQVSSYFMHLWCRASGWRSRLWTVKQAQGV